HKYDNGKTIGFKVDEKPVISAMLKGEKLSTDASAAVKGASTLRDIATKLEAVQRTAEDDAFKAKLEARIGATDWHLVVVNEVWKQVYPMMPRFLYFDDYYTLPGKVNLQDLAQRAGQEAQNPAVLEPQHRAVLALLRMADINV